MPKLKDFFKNFTFSSQCCNTTTLDDDEVDDILVRRIETLEKQYEKCLKHQYQLRGEITVLLERLKILRRGSSTGSSDH